ncbi:MAG: hypothetical protein Fur0041_16730 [Bacteroidia bacterium]
MKKGLIYLLCVAIVLNAFLFSSIHFILIQRHKIFVSELKKEFKELHAVSLELTSDEIQNPLVYQKINRKEVRIYGVLYDIISITEYENGRYTYRCFPDKYENELHVILRKNTEDQSSQSKTALQKLKGIDQYLNITDPLPVLFPSTTTDTAFRYIHLNPQTDPESVFSPPDFSC